MTVQVIVVRHGERLDEVDRQAWRAERTEATRNDPPLTERGWAHAGSVGQQLRSLIAPGAAVTVYSSPTSRTLSTAAALAGPLRVGSITPAYALNCCAAAQSQGVLAFPSAHPPEGVLRGARLSGWPPIGDPEQVDQRQRQGRGFAEAVAELAARHAGGETVVMVTHREGMWQLAKLASRSRMARRVEYCAFHFYAFDPAEARLTAAQEPEAPPQAPQPRQEWSFSTPPRDRPAPAAAAPPGARGGPPRGAPPAEGHRRRWRWGALTDPAAGSAEVFAMEEALAATLARGHGRVAVARSRDRRGAPRREAAAALRQWCGAAAPWPLAPSAPRRGARLWCTPGVRGADERVPDGEVVELLSCPQPSEGGLGDFVRVRRGGGDEGWVKVEHVRLAG